MTEILKTEAIVLSKLDYSDSSKIADLFTKDYGKLAAIIKGGRGKNSKTGIVVDPLNIISIVLYKKDSREVQLISQAEIKSYFINTRSDIEKIKYAYSILELIKSYTKEHEVQDKLYKGTCRILELIDSSNEHPAILFLRFFIFFLSEAGYEIQIENCSSCHKKVEIKNIAGFSYETGIICHECVSEVISNTNYPAELFGLLYCLKNKKPVISFDDKTITMLLNIIENFFRHHMPEYKGLKSLKL